KSKPACVALSRLAQHLRASVLRRLGSVPMHERTMVLRLKRFETSQKALKVAVLEKMIFDFDNTAADLVQQIAAEESRTRIKDTRHVAYSTFAAAAAVRRRNLLISAADLKP